MEGSWCNGLHNPVWCFFIMLYKCSNDISYYVTLLKIYPLNYIDVNVNSLKMNLKHPTFSGKQYSVFNTLAKMSILLLIIFGRRSNKKLLNYF